MQDCHGGSRARGTTTDQPHQGDKRESRPNETGNDDDDDDDDDDEMMMTMMMMMMMMMMMI